VRAGTGEGAGAGDGEGGSVSMRPIAWATDDGLEPIDAIDDALGWSLFVLDGAAAPSQSSSLSLAGGALAPTGPDDARGGGGGGGALA
jgi:hypothetical protein